MAQTLLSEALERYKCGIMDNKVFGFDFTKAWEYENGFNITSHPSRFAKLISHWEIYKRIVDIPGVIVECGVFKGSSLIRFATFREMLESPYSRKIIGFDAFGKFPCQELESDIKYVEYFEKMCGNGIGKSDLQKVFKRKSFVNIELIEGNILDMLKIYFDKNPQLKIALLHIDVDVYEATKYCLEFLYSKVVCGGIVLLDDYSTANAGATRAIDEFFDTNNNNIQIHKNPFYQSPCYIIKK